MTYREKMPDGTVRITGATPADTWPVGSIYLSILSANPATLFGGTWVRLAKGRMLVGVDELDASFDQPRDVGGAKTVTLTVANMPIHDHSINHDHANADTATEPAHQHQVPRKAGVGVSTGYARGNGTNEPNDSTGVGGAHNHVVNIPSYSGTSGSRGSGTAHDNMPPFYAVYIWERTA